MASSSQQLVIPDVPYISQFSSSGLRHLREVILRPNATLQTQIADSEEYGDWQAAGAASKSAYAWYAPQICGLAAWAMAQGYFLNQPPPLPHSLVNKDTIGNSETNGLFPYTKYYKDGFHLTALKYIPFTEYVANVTSGVVKAQVYLGQNLSQVPDDKKPANGLDRLSPEQLREASNPLTYERAVSHIKNGGLAILSVAPDIRRPDSVRTNPNARGGHLVLAIAANDDQIVFHDPAGLPAVGGKAGTQRNNHLSREQFGQFFGQRGVLLSRNSPSNLPK